MTREQNLEARYRRIDNALEALQVIMHPKNRRTELEIAKASIEYHKLCVSRWELRLEELHFNRWVLEQRRKQNDTDNSTKPRH